MKYLLFGDDTLALRFRKRELLEDFSRNYPGGHMLIFDFSAQEKGTLEKLEEEVSPALFETPKILVIEGVESLYTTHPERIENLFTAPTPASLIFVEPTKLTKTNPFFTVAKKYTDEESYDLKKRDLGKFVESLQEKLGGKLDAQTLSAIRERSGKDDELALQNIQKVLTYTQGSKPSSAELDALVPAPLETKVFDALDALVGGQKERALTLFHRILIEEDIFRIFPLCAWQIRQMLLVTEGKEQFGDQKEKIAKESNMHPFVVQKILRVLPNFPRTRLARGLRMLSDLDVDLKLSRKTPEGALQYFVFHW